MKRLGLFALLAVVACGPAPNLLPVDDLNRPTDVAFMCFGAFPGADGAMHVSGRPMRACHPQGQYDPGPTSTTRTFAFLPNSAAGTLSVVDADHWKLVDLDLDTAGYGTAPLGQLPSQISASDDGCRLISANRGSCDLTVVDPSVLVSPVFSSQNGVNLAPVSPRTGAQTFRPIKGDGTQLLAAPYEAVFLPQDTTTLVTPPASNSLPYLQGQGPLCSDTGPVVDPVSGPSGTNSWYALVTYPSCDLITVVQLPSGKIVSSAKVSSTDGKTVQLTDTGPSPVCPLSAGDCAGQVLPQQPSASDAATGDGARHVAPGDGAADSGSAGAATDASASGTGGATATGGTTGTGGATTGTGGATGSSDAGATGGASGGGAVLGNQFRDDPFVGSPIGPSGIAIVPNGKRAYVSLANASYVLSIDLTNSGHTLPGNAITLHEGARGSQRVRLNVDPTRIGVGGAATIAGAFVGEEPGWLPPGKASVNFAGPQEGREYLYVIARDGTLRVVSVVNQGAETECETNADPVYLPMPYSSSTACIPVNPSYRRPFSVGPGIHFGSSLPLDVAAADIQRPGAGTDGLDDSEQTVSGAYAWVITDSTFVYLVNLNPVLRTFSAVIPSADPKIPGQVDYGPGGVQESPPFVNTLRDRNQITYSVTLDPSTGPPRVDAPPPVPATGPYIEPFWTQGVALNATSTSGAYIQTSVFFTNVPHPTNANDPVDRRAITPQTWTVAWEGALTGNRNTGKAYSASGTGDDSQGFPGPVTWTPLPAVDSLFVDGGGSYCQIGVVPGDMITLTGCTSNSQCGIGEVCVNGTNGSSATAGLAVTGICVDPNREGSQEASCSEFLNSLRRYEILGASQSNVVMRPHLDEVVLSSLTPDCQPTTGADGGAAADAGVGADGGVQPTVCADTLDDSTTARFTCETSYPGGGGRPRCLMRCSTDSECRAGRVCVDFNSGLAGDQLKTEFPDAAADVPDDKKCPNCFCADAPPFDSSGTGKGCFDQLVNYQVVAGKSFIVSGSQTGIVTTSTARPSGACDPNPTPDPRFGFRIPLNAAMNAVACTNVPDVTKIDSRVDPQFATDATDGGVPNANTLINVVTSTPAPTSPCLYRGGPVSGDPSSNSTMVSGAGPTHVRALFKNAQLSFVLANIDRGPTFQFATTFDVHGGFSPQLVQDPATIQVSMPARIVIGPVDSVPQVLTGTSMDTFEAPYLFVVDQRRLGGGQGGGATRGQLLRINPFGYQSTVGSVTGYQPIFEDYNATGGLFPIQ